MKERIAFLGIFFSLCQVVYCTDDQTGGGSAQNCFGFGCEETANFSDTLAVVGGQTAPQEDLARNAAGEGEELQWPSLDFPATDPPEGGQSRSFSAQSPYADILRAESQLDPNNAFLTKDQSADYLPYTDEVQALKGENMFLGREAMTEQHSSFIDNFEQVSDAYWSGRLATPQLADTIEEVKADLVTEQSRLQNLISIK